MMAGTCGSIRVQPDRELIELDRNGDPAAFAELPNCLAPLLMTGAHGITGNWADGAEAVQEAMGKAHFRLQYRIAVNEALMQLRTSEKSARDAYWLPPSRVTVFRGNGGCRKCWRGGMRISQNCTLRSISETGPAVAVCVH